MNRAERRSYEFPRGHKGSNKHNILNKGAFGGTIPKSMRNLAKPE